MKIYLANILTILASASTVLCGGYVLQDNIIGSGFYNAFTFENIADPTSGRVNYVDQATAQSQNLSYASSNDFILRADSWTVLNPSGPGRNSFRIRSIKTYTTAVMVFDIRHMPEGCGTWPAVWTTDESNWPNGGEVDILEGVNNLAPNTATLHTASGCTMPSSRTQLGTASGLDCNSATGCTVHFPTTQSYGSQFNAGGGGWYAMERTSSDIRVWFWPRNGAVPSDIQNGATTINTDNWGTPAADFPNTDCNYAQYFDAHNIIINLTFCGQWAGVVYSQDGCPGTCTDYVNNDPSAFSNAYFDFGSLRVFE
ncbi:glycoside hydrolase family 16 protein [Amanita muscaria Koide BX008]|uniref:Glycoside hydrolase family 16 protein n=1 Tax=Amanita muscaria (strain Koide BX008) TaxID=946122 RepID=A0A0C2WH47_AMAMK|nr:glycoside hydrolase family 16 protein [Amanita muscaria Koide BX008]